MQFQLFIQFRPSGEIDFEKMAAIEDVELLGSGD